jgi:hypothetical protein
MKRSASSAILIRDPQDAETVLFVSRKQSEPMVGEGRTKLLAVEPVLGRVGDESTKKEIGIKGRVNFFKVEEAALNKNPGDFSNPLFPVLQVMDDAEIEDGIHAGVRVRKVLSIGNEKKGKPPYVAVEPFRCKPDHQGIDINAVQPARMKHIVNELRSFAPAASDLDAKGVRRKRSGLLKKGHLSSLDPGTHWAVDPDSFRPIDFHAFKLCLS